MIEQIRQTARGGGIVAGLLIGQQQTLAVAVLGGRQSKFRIEQNRGGVLGQNFRHQRFEFDQRVVVDRGAFFLGQRLLQGTALIHGGGGNHAAFIGEGFHAGQFAGGELHRRTLLVFCLVGSVVVAALEGQDHPSKVHPFHIVVFILRWRRKGNR